MRERYSTPAHLGPWVRDAFFRLRVSEGANSLAAEALSVLNQAAKANPAGLPRHDYPFAHHPHLMIDGSVGSPEDFGPLKAGANLRDSAIAVLVKVGALRYPELTITREGAFLALELFDHLDRQGLLEPQATISKRTDESNQGGHDESSGDAETEDEAAVETETPSPSKTRWERFVEYSGPVGLAWSVLSSLFKM